MTSILARASLVVNLSLVASLVGLSLVTIGGGRQLEARAQVTAPPAGTAKSTPELQPAPAQPPAAPSPTQPIAPAQRAEAKGDAIVPPMQRKLPPPGKTSVPIVAPPAKKAAAPKPKAPPKQGVVPAAPANNAVKGKAPPAGQKSALGLKPTALPKCANGFSYDAKKLKCAKPAAGTVAAPAPAKAPPVSAKQ